MRVLHVNRFVYRVGGAESYMLSLASLQRAAGHEVELFGTAPPEESGGRYRAEYPQPVDRHGSARGKASAFGRMMWSSSSRRGIRHVLREFEPDVVHLHNVYHELSPSVLGPIRDYGVPCVMTLHDYKLACPSQEMLAHGELCDACLPGRYWHAARTRCKDGSLPGSIAVSAEAYLHRALRSYDAVQCFLCPSQFMADTMVRAQVYPERLRVLPHFLDAAQTSAKVHAGDVFVYAGRLVPSKGVDVLIDAMAQVPEARLAVAGEGPERERLQSKAAHVAPGQVTFMGQLDRTGLFDLLHSARALVLPARWYENQPMSVLEAQAVGVPVIASDLGGLPELVQHGNTGFLASSGDFASLARQLQRLESDQEEAVSLGRAARESVLRHFDPAAHLERVVQTYHDAADSASNALPPIGEEHRSHDRGLGE